ncbi:MAG: cytochrome P450 [Nocardiopsaceae bacterium]|jgi:cytochrome P450|nr:cytochrome P450 [Nocardiopsaceae bacterium]
MTEPAAAPDGEPAPARPLPSVDELDLPFFDYDEPGLTGEVYHQRLAAVREQGWLARSPLAVVVLDRESGEFFLRARETAFPGREIADLFGITAGRLRDMIDANILNLTGERHRRLRALVGPAFTPRAAARWRPVMREFLAALWEGLGGATECDVVRAIAKPYPALTIAAVLGAPPGDAPRLHEWSSWVQRQFDIRALASEAGRIEEAVIELHDYAEGLLALRRREPSDDLLSALLAAEADGERLTHEECVNLVLNVLAGGVDTTQAQLSHALRLFAAHPRQWELLRQQPDLVPQAVAEVLRHEPITPFTARICTGRIEHRGVVFPPGTIVAVCAERANRDQQAGEEFDITAERDARVLTFGAGAHFCLGANLARAELAEALTFLAPRLPGLRPAGEPVLGGVEGIYGIDSLPLAWSAG